MRFFMCVLCTCFSIVAQQNLVFIQDSKTLKNTITRVVNQARLFNPKANIYLIAEKKECEKIKDELENIHLIFFENITLSPIREFFQIRSNKHVHSDYFATLRFFVLHDLCKELRLQNMFLLSTEMMLYTDLQRYERVFEYHYPFIGVAKAPDDRICPYLFYFSNQKSLENFCRHLCKTSIQESIVKALDSFGRLRSHVPMDYLPIIFPEYVIEHGFIDSKGKEPVHPGDFWNQYDRFSSFFDGGTLYPLFLSKKARSTKGMIDFSDCNCIFSEDEEQRMVPFIEWNSRLYRINTLYIGQNTD